MSDTQERAAPLSGRTRRRWTIALLVLVAAGGVAAGTGALKGLLPAPHVAGDRTTAPAARAPQAVKVIAPRHDPGLAISVEQIAVVEAYFQADLKTRVSGIVRSMTKDIGDKVHRGDLLVDIDVPELDQEVLQKEGIVAQRKQELRVAEVKLDNALALVDVARAAVKQAKATVAAADATREFRRRRLARFQDLAGRDTVGASVVEEEEKEYQASAAAVEAARASVEKADADQKEKESSVAAARVDIDLKGTLVDVAKRDLDRSRAMIAYAKVTAPFDGVVVRRTADPGAFVQNATSGASEPLVTVARTDLLTVVAKFPDNVAPLISPGTPVAIRLDDLPGVTVNAKVSRYSPAIRTSDRTFAVEVDLFNGTREQYDRVIAKSSSRHLMLLAAANPLEAASLEQVARDGDHGFRKGDGEHLPAFASTGEGRILPGMNGRMRLTLGSFTHAYAVPSTAIYNRSGVPYVLLVENGKTRQVAARVQVNDGTTAKVALLERGADGREVLRELTGSEQIVAGRQLEVGDGTSVVPSPTDW